MGSKGVVDEKQVGASESGEKVARKIGPGDFQILRVVGRGAFGKVFLVRKKSDCFDGEGGGDGIFAMKVMRKETIIKNNHVDYMKAERDILTKVVHPFIVQLRYSFQVLFLYLDSFLDKSKTTLVHVEPAEFIHPASFFSFEFLLRGNKCTCGKSFCLLSVPKLYVSPLEHWR